jgi:hypothetical protein
MSDKELIAFLRDLPFLRAAAAADRIEELTAKLATCEKYRDAYAECDSIGTQAVRDLEAKLAECEARLGKAVEGLRYYAVEAMPWDADDSLIARTTLAEIEGLGVKQTG